MRPIIVILVILFAGNSVYAQVENSGSLRIDAESDEKTDNYGLTKGIAIPNPKSNFKLYNSLRDSLGFNRTHRPFSMINDNNGLLRPEADSDTPKWFKKDNELIKEEYKSDQYLGDFKSNGEFVQLLYRDHQSVDGDLVRILVNDDIIRSSVFLGSTFKGIKINMVKGFNKIDIIALNQGDSGPNTAAFHLYDDQGTIITSNLWNLTTGVKATLIVFKE